MNNALIGIIEDDSTDCEIIKEFCEKYGKDFGTSVNVDIYNDVEGYIKSKKIFDYDLLIIDLSFHNDPMDRSGWNAVENVLNKEFIPIIVYSGHGGDGIDAKYTNPFIKIIIKGTGTDLSEEINKLIKIKLKFNTSKRKIIGQFEKISLDTIKNIIGTYKLEDIDDTTLQAIAYYRISSYIMNIPPEGENKFPPESIFIHPCLDLPDTDKESLILGTILKRKSNNTFWIILSPSCDLISSQAQKPKINHVLILPCYTKPSESISLSKIPDASRKNHLQEGIKKNIYKIIQCPQYLFGCKYLLLHYKDYLTIEYNKLNEDIKNGEMIKIASLASPYAESVQNTFIRDISRVGTPYTAKVEEEIQWAAIFLSDNLIK